MSLLKLKVRADGPTARNCRVWLDNYEISHGLQGLTITFDVGDVNRAELRIMIDELDVDAETLNVLAAHIAAPPESSAEAGSADVTSMTDGARTYMSA